MHDDDGDIDMKEMSDSDCSEDYDNDIFFQQSGYAFYKIKEEEAK